jgi:hypothetical protein
MTQWNKVVSIYRPRIKSIPSKKCRWSHVSGCEGAENSREGCVIESGNKVRKFYKTLGPAL